MEAPKHLYWFFDDKLLWSVRSYITLTTQDYTILSLRKKYYFATKMQSFVSFAKIWKWHNICVCATQTTCISLKHTYFSEPILWVQISNKISEDE